MSGPEGSGESCPQCNQPKFACKCPKTTAEAQGGQAPEISANLQDQDTASNEKYPRPGSPEAQELHRLHEEFYRNNGGPTPREAGLEQLQYNWQKEEILGVPRDQRGKEQYENPNSRQNLTDKAFFQTPEAVAEFEKNGWTLPKSGVDENK